MNEYDKQAKDFLEKTNTTFKAEYSNFGFHFDGDTEPRSIFDITLSNERSTYTFKFGISINDSRKKFVKYPNEYDVLSCITKYDPETFEDFCDSFGYDNDSRKAYKVYESVVEEYNNVAELWSEEEIEELSEIQ